MKIFAQIDVEKIQRSASTYSFRSEVMECEVVRVIRHRCDRTRMRHTYQADIKRPASMHPESHFWSGAERIVRVNIMRNLNRTWKAPAFPEGGNIIEVTA